MLTEFGCRVLIADLRQNVSYVFGTWDINPKIFRYGEGFDKKHPYITVQFLPANRQKFKSLGNVIGRARIAGGDYVFGWCQMENVVIRAYCHEQSQTRTIPGRLVTEFLIEKVRLHILRNWGFLLPNLYAELDDFESVNNVDRTVYDKRKGSKVYCYELNFMLRTQFRWDDLPEDFVEDVLVDEIKVVELNEGRNQGPIVYENVGIDLSEYED